MKNSPIQVMLNEHQVIKRSKSIIDGAEGAWEINALNYIELVDRLIVFFREYADGYHHRKEEEILFPAIKNHPDFVLDEMIYEFEDHHESFRDYTSLIEQALDDNDFPKSYNLLQEYYRDLLDHIAAEDDELFVLAENLLDENELEIIFFKFKDVDIELGEERKKELENSIAVLI